MKSSLTTRRKLVQRYHHQTDVPFQSDFVRTTVEALLKDFHLKPGATPGTFTKHTGGGFMMLHWVGNAVFLSWTHNTTKKGCDFLTVISEKATVQL
jgi:hypothetical protein